MLRLYAAGLAELPFPARSLSDGVVKLRPTRDGDARVFASLGADPASRRWIGIPADYDVEQARAFAEASEQARRAGRSVLFVITDASGGIVLGDCALHVREADRRIGELGYLVLPAARGRGYATRAVRLLVAYAHELGIDHLRAFAHPQNMPSQRVLARAGFVEDRVLPDYRGPGEDRIRYSLARP
jgi:RimJ/RimL family protein N-acetyltransferase